MTEQQFLEIYDIYADALYRHCYFRVLQKEEAEDLVQSTFVKTWQYVVNGKTIDNMKAFLYTVANNLIIDSSRRQTESSLDKLQEEGFDPGEDRRHQLESYLDGARVRTMIQKLSPEYRDVVVMRYIDDLGPKEIAHITGESQNVISVRLNRAIKQLRSILKYE